MVKVVILCNKHILLYFTSRGYVQRVHVSHVVYNITKFPLTYFHKNFLSLLFPIVARFPWLFLQNILAFSIGVFSGLKKYCLSPFIIQPSSVTSYAAKQKKNLCILLSSYTKLVVVDHTTL